MWPSPIHINTSRQLSTGIENRRCRDRPADGVHQYQSVLAFSSAPMYRGCWREGINRARADKLATGQRGKAPPPGNIAARMSDRASGDGLAVSKSLRRKC